MIIPVDWERLEAVYGSYASYRTKVEQAVGRFVQDRWVTESDGEKIKAELMTIAPPPGSAGNR